MQRLVFFTLLATVCWAQQYNRDSKTAAIISDSRYLSGNGNFGSAYTQEDGIQFKEETDPDGNRRGSYSYIDPSGQRKTISYTAGKNGFQASGDHLPQAPAAPPQAAPQPQYTPQPQYQPPAQPQYQPQYQPQAQPQYQPQAQPQYQAPAQPQYQSPAGFDDGSYRAEYNDPDYDTKYKNSGAARPAPTPNQFQYNFPSQQPAAPAYNPQPVAYTTTTTPAPHRFYPPGRLDLNRTPDGFSYTFNKS